MVLVTARAPLDGWGCVRRRAAPWGVRRVRAAHRGPLLPAGRGQAVARAVPHVQRLPLSPRLRAHVLCSRRTDLLQGGLLQVSQSSWRVRGSMMEPCVSVHFLLFMYVHISCSTMLTLFPWMWSTLHFYVHVTSMCSLFVFTCVPICLVDVFFACLYVFSW